MNDRTLEAQKSTWARPKYSKNGKITPSKKNNQLTCIFSDILRTGYINLKIS